MKARLEPTIKFYLKSCYLCNQPASALIILIISASFATFISDSRQSTSSSQWPSSNFCQPFSTIRKRALIRILPINPTVNLHLAKNIGPPPLHVAKFQHFSKNEKDALNHPAFLNFL
jgi:hypothetical protein